MPRSRIPKSLANRMMNNLMKTQASNGAKNAAQASRQVLMHPMNSSVNRLNESQQPAKCGECHKECRRDEFTVCRECVSKKVDNSEKAIVKIGLGLPKQCLSMPTCLGCGEQYDLAGVIPKKLKCNHSLCAGCTEKAYDAECDVIPGCNYVPCLDCDIQTPLPNGGPKYLPVHVELTAEMSRIAKEIKREEEVSFVVCTQCGKMDIEHDMHVCRDCTFQKYQVDVQATDLKLRPGSVDEFAICSTCVLKSHVLQSHIIVPFYPLRASSQIVECRRIMVTKANELDAKIEQFELLWDTSSKTIARTKKELDKMMGLMVRCSSSLTRSAVERVFDFETKQAILYADTLVQTMERMNKVQMEHINQLFTKNAQFEALNCPAQAPSMSQRVADSRNVTVVNQGKPTSQTTQRCITQQQQPVRLVSQQFQARPQPLTAPASRVVRVAQSGAVYVPKPVGMVQKNTSMSEQRKEILDEYRKRYLPSPRVLFPNGNGDGPEAKIKK